MDEQILARLEAQDKKLEAIYVSVEKTRRYFQWTMIITVATVVLPLVGLAFVIPKFMGSLQTIGF